MSDWNTETAQWYADNYGDYATNRLCVDALELSADSTVVDIGCGTGSALRHASRQVTHGSLIGIDPVVRMIELARQQTEAHCAADRIKFYMGAAESLPIEDACADFVLAFDSFDHWINPVKGLAEVKRILVCDGHFVVVKDGGLPNGSKSRKVFFEALKNTGFNISKEALIDDANVSFTFWVCRLMVSDKAI